MNLNDNLNFEVLCLTFADFYRFTAVKEQASGMVAFGSPPSSSRQENAWQMAGGCVQDGGGYWRKKETLDCNRADLSKQNKCSHFSER